MDRIKIILSTLTLCILLPLLAIGQDNLFRVQGDTPSQADVAQIQKIVLRMVMGVKYQRPYLVYKHFHPDLKDVSPASWEELDRLKVTLGELMQTLDRRSAADKLLPGMSNTFDFADLQKTLEFVHNGTRAKMQIELGFYKLPGDPSLLDKLPVQEFNAMKEHEKARKSRFRSVGLEFHKMDGTWYLSSLSTLESALKDMTSYYGKIDLSPAKVKD